MKTSNLYKVTHIPSEKSSYVVAENEGCAIDKFIALFPDNDITKYECLVRWVEKVIV